MRIRRIALKNLNSLYGEHAVDLDQDLHGAPLFLIRGPTGSGKSTLTDAVALALFGQTPRLDRREGDDTDPRLVLSRGTGDGWAQVEFTKVEDGTLVRYRATWKCHRARGAADGSFQDVRRVLDRHLPDGTWTALASDHRAKFYQGEFDRVLEGLTVEDFRRMIVLAQGEFAAFLEANEADRARILERLTNTSRFREIGRRAHVRRQEADRGLEDARIAMEGVVLLGEAEEVALRAEVGEIGAREVLLRGDLDRVRSWAAWLERLREALEVTERSRGQEAATAAARAERAAELAELQEHQRCQPAAEALVLLDRARGDQAQEQARLPDLQQAEADGAGRLAEAEKAREERVRTRDTAAEASATREPEIRQAREVRLALTGALTERNKAEGAAAEADKKVRKAQGEEQKAVDAATVTKSASDQAAETVRMNQTARPLTEALPALESRWAVVQHDRGEWSRRTDLAGQNGQELKRMDEVAAGLRTAREALVPQVDVAQARVVETGLALTAAQGGEPDSAARRKRLLAEDAGLTTRLQTVGEARRLTEEVATTAAAVAALSEQAEQAREASEACERDIATLSAAQALADAGLQEVQARREEAAFIAHLARQRGWLRPDQACPLCGSTDHPYVSDPRWADLDRTTAERLAELDDQVRNGEKARNEAIRQGTDLARRLAALQTKRDSAIDARKLRETERATLATRLQEALRTLGLNDPSGLDTVDAEARQGRARIALEHGALDTAETASRTAQDVLREAADRLRETDQALAIRASERATKGAALDAERSDLDARGTALEQAEAALARNFETLGVPADRPDGPPDIAATVAAARSRVQALKDADVALERAQRLAVEAGAKLDTARELRGTLEAAAAQAATERATRVDQVIVLEAQAAVVLEGRDPEAVEQALRSALKSAEAELERAVTATSTCQQALVAAQTARTGCEARIAEKTREAEERCVALDQALRLLGVADETALVQRRLDEATAAERLQLRDRLDRETQEAATRRQTNEERLAAVRIEQPPEFDPASHTAEGLQVRVTELAGEHEVAVGLVAALRERVRVQEEAQTRHGERAAAFAVAQREADLWRRLAGLIGSNEGEAFQKYAQTLNLTELIAKANLHLASLEPRYSLVPGRGPNGEPRLAFSIRDAYQAGETRPLKTLSGGETFLVSLALALALADYRTLRMPVETLLLDEGFGTLDSETLQIAMRALESLHARGTQVGVISHVEALRESIPACIVVEKGANGRSQLRCELG
jgi:exonuclease SbcC